MQIPADHVGLVVAQVGAPLPVGAKSAAYRAEFANFDDLRAFVARGGEKGVQRPVLAPGTLAPIHPVGFLVVTKGRAFGRPVSAEIRQLVEALTAFDLRVTRIEPDANGRDVCGIVTVLEGPPVEAGDIASRLGGFADIAALEKEGRNDAELIEALLQNKNHLHNNYQDLQRFLDGGGRSGLQHDALPYGAYNLNPLLVRVERVPMLVVEQGEVAVVKAYIGLPTADTSGPQFKHGSLVHPGHRGLWQEPLRVGKYMVNPRLYDAIKVPTAILTLNWADYSSKAHDLDKELKPIDAKSREGFRFYRPAGAAARARHDGAARDLARGLDEQPRDRAAAGRRGQPLPQHAAEHGGDRVHREARHGAGVRERARPQDARGLRGRDGRRLHPGRRPARGADARPQGSRDREPGDRDVRKKKQQAEAERKNVAEATASPTCRARWCGRASA